MNTTSRGASVQKSANYFPSQQATNNIHWPNSLFIQRNVSVTLISFADTPAAAQKTTCKSKQGFTRSPLASEKT